MSKTSSGEKVFLLNNFFLLLLQPVNMFFVFVQLLLSLVLSLNIMDW
jgi:hypothetical protein